MKPIQLSVPELAGIAATRGMLGAGLALLLCDHLNRRQQRTLGAILATLGVLTTVPFAADVLSQSKTRSPDRHENEGTE